MAGTIQPLCVQVGGALASAPVDPGDDRPSLSAGYGRDAARTAATVPDGRLIGQMARSIQPPCIGSREDRGDHPEIPIGDDRLAGSITDRNMGVGDVHARGNPNTVEGPQRIAGMAHPLRIDVTLAPDRVSSQVIKAPRSSAVTCGELCLPTSAATAMPFSAHCRLPFNAIRWA